MVARLRKILGLNDRDISVLEALVSFHPAKILDLAQPLVVHPANATLCERLNGMPCSTMRRHLARLVDAGLVIRRDSPNGKRFSRQSAAGKIAFGFDLSPLVTSQFMLRDMDDAASAEALAVKTLREAVILMRRDLLALSDASEALTLCAEAARMLRRNMDLAALEDLQQQFQDQLSALPAEKPSSSDSQNEQHYQKLNKIIFESESDAHPDISVPVAEVAGPRDDLSLPMVLDACPAMASYHPDTIRNWQDLRQASDRLRPMMQIGESLWHQAKSRLGADGAAVVLAAILQRFSEIRSAGAYLRHLVEQAVQTSFSPRPMIMALLRKQGSQL